IVVGVLVALSLATSLAFLWPDLDAVAAEPTDAKKARPTLNPRPAGWNLADAPLARSADPANAPASGRARSAAATQPIVNQSGDQVTELRAGWRTFDGNGITVGGEVMWGIRSDCWAHSGTHAVWATANGQNGEPDCQKPYPNVTDSWLVYGPFSLANATSAA